MSFTTTTLTNPTATKLHKVTPASGSGSADGQEDELNSGATDLAQVHIDNSTNAAATAYVKLWNNTATNVTVGTTAPSMILPCPGGATITYAFPQETSFANGCTITAVTTGGTGGTTRMTNAITVYVLQG
jgi:hypothetical protein